MHVFTHAYIVHPIIVYIIFPTGTVHLGVAAMCIMAMDSRWPPNPKNILHKRPDGCYRTPQTMAACFLCKEEAALVVCSTDTHVWHRACLQRLGTATCPACTFTWPADLDMLDTLLEMLPLLGNTCLDLSEHPMAAADWIYRMYHCSIDNTVAFRQLILRGCDLRALRWPWPAQLDGESIQMADLSNNALRRWPNPDAFGTALTDLDLSHNLLSGSLIFTGKHYGALRPTALGSKGQVQTCLPPLLKYLRLNGNAVDTLEIRSAASLVYVSASYTNLRSCTIEACPALQSVVLEYGCLCATAVTIDRVSRQLLGELNLCGNSTFWGSYGDATGELYMRLLGHAPFLSVVNLSHTGLNMHHVVTYTAAMDPPLHLQALMAWDAIVPYTLDMELQTPVFDSLLFMDLSESNVREIPHLPTHICELRLDRCASLTFNTAQELDRDTHRFLPESLTSLSMRYCESVAWIPSYLMRVRALDVRGCMWCSIDRMHQFNRGSAAEDPLAYPAELQTCHTCRSAAYVVPTARLCFHAIHGETVPVMYRRLMCPACRLQDHRHV